jgi:superfamily I DNA/RNA helicase
MNLTVEQTDIIEYDGDSVINAVAGSGKTFTLVEKVKRHPDRKFLYVVYNRPAKNEAIRKFLSAGISNARIETAHSLAYREMDVRNRYTLSESGNLKAYDIVKLCNIRPKQANPVYHLILARHVQKLLTLYCNSDEQKLAGIDYLATICDVKAADFVRNHYDKIYGHARDILTRMYTSKVPIIHDAYLKFWQLTDPVLPYSDVLFDEGQDASPVMLDVFLKQDVRKCIVGDRHQQIYRFRSAVNSLDKVDFQRFNLSTSFRFPQEIADLAMKTLRLKKRLGLLEEEPDIKGVGICDELDSYAVLARSNLKLLDRAIEVVINGTKRIHFEGDLNSYAYASEGGSLYDILYLRLCQPQKIRDEFVRSFASFSALQDYISQAEDNELSLMVEIVNKYGSSLWDYMRLLKECQVPKESADVIFSTVHKAKGAEYDQVEVCQGFITGDKINSILATSKFNKEKNLDLEALAEEVNILYVCITRTKNDLLMDFDVETGNTGNSQTFDGLPVGNDTLHEKVRLGGVF